MGQYNYFDDGPTLYTLTDEDGKQWNFELLDEMDYADSHYYAMTPASDSKEKSLSGDQPLIVMRVIEDEQTGEEDFEMVDEAELERIGPIFMERLGILEDSLYEDEETYNYSDYFEE